MCKNYVNIYKSARETKGFTQEKVAELLNVSVESIRDYESSKRCVPNDIVAEMCNVYSNERLAYFHLRQSDVGRMVLPELKSQGGLAMSILTHLKEDNDLIACRNDLISIGADGVISEDERERFDEIIKELDELRAAMYSLKFSSMEH